MKIAQKGFCSWLMRHARPGGMSDGASSTSMGKVVSRNLRRVEGCEGERRVQRSIRVKQHSPYAVGFAAEGMHDEVDAEW